jgi:hypothetical protein
MNKTQNSLDEKAISQSLPTIPMSVQEHTDKLLADNAGDTDVKRASDVSAPPVPQSTSTVSMTHESQSKRHKRRRQGESNSRSSTSSSSIVPDVKTASNRYSAGKRTLKLFNNSESETESEDNGDLYGQSNRMNLEGDVSSSGNMSNNPPAESSITSTKAVDLITPINMHIDISETTPSHLSDFLSGVRARQFRQWFAKLRIHSVFFVCVLCAICLSIFYFPYILQNNYDIEEQNREWQNRVWGPDGAFDVLQLDELGLSLGYYECNACLKIGYADDSNWTVCWDTMRPPTSCIAYVFRPIVGNLSFEVGIQRLGCQVFLFFYESIHDFDSSSPVLPDYKNTRLPNGIYTIRMLLSDREVGDNWCWSSERCDWEEHTLATIMQMMNHSFVDIIRIGNHSQDVWPIFTQMIHDTPFENQRVGQLLIELNLFSNPAPTQFIEPLQTLRQNEYELFSRIPSPGGQGLRFLLSYVMYDLPYPHPLDWLFP